MEKTISRMTKVGREKLLAALLKTVSDNFPILTERQAMGVALHFRNHMAPIIAKTDVYKNTLDFGKKEMSDAFAEVLAKRILHISSLSEEPPIEEEN